MSGGKNGQYGGRGVSNDPRSDPVSPSNEAGQDNCRGSPWRRGSGYAAEPYMYYITIIYITYIRMENID